MFDLSNLLTLDAAVSLLTLAALEIVLGIDNIVFISILTGRLPEHERARARRLGLLVAMLARIGLLLVIGWVVKLDKTALVTLPATVLTPEGSEAARITGKDLILLVGGLFLIAKATKEIHHKLDGGESPAGEHPDPARRLVSTKSVIAQILMIDIVFSLDSVITAVGMAKHIEVMIAAVMIAVGVMMIFAAPVASFIEKHATIKMLALSFLLLIGVMLTAESFGAHISHGYVYFAMAFSLGVEMLNLWAASRSARRRAQAAKPASATTS